jgi:molecular chaperone GrpE
MTDPEKDKIEDTAQVENEQPTTGNTEENTEKEPVSTVEASETDNLKMELGEMKEKYIRLYSEFDNFRKRTAKEKIDLAKTASEDVIKSLLSTLDDFERALKAFGDDEQVKLAKEGVEIIYNKLYKTLEAKGLKAMVSIGETFDVELHEAITQIPAPSEDMKGKIIDEVEKGYYLNDKVIRFAKVVTGA